MKLELKQDSWKNLFKCIRQSEIKSEGEYGEQRSKLKK